MRYLKAYLSTFMLVVIPIISLPLLQWYKRTFCESDTDLGGIYALLVTVTIGMLALTVIKWIEALKGKDIKDMKTFM